MLISELWERQAASMLEKGRSGLQERVRKLVKHHTTYVDPDTLFAHTWDSRNSPAGFPDCVIWLPLQHRLIVAELKRQKTRPSEDQIGWLDAFSWIPSIEVYLWRPLHLITCSIDSALLMVPTPSVDGYKDFYTTWGVWRHGEGVPGDKFSKLATKRKRR